MAPWVLVLIGTILVWVGLKNRASDLIDALFAGASPYHAQSSAAPTASGADNQGAPATTGSGPAVG